MWCYALTRAEIECVVVWAGWLVCLLVANGSVRVKVFLLLDETTRDVPRLFANDGARLDSGECHSATHTHKWQRWLSSFRRKCD